MERKHRLETRIRPGNGPSIVEKCWTYTSKTPQTVGERANASNHKMIQRIRGYLSRTESRLEIGEVPRRADCLVDVLVVHANRPSRMKLGGIETRV